MIMITGGAFQGKRDFVKKQFALSDSDIADGGNCELSELTNARCICNYELAVKRMLADYIDPLGFTAGLNCEIVIMNEIGGGIIPIEKSEREWREMTGRAGCILADRAEKVYRVCCGIATMIKGEQA